MKELVRVHLHGKTEARKSLALVQWAKRRGVKVTGKASRRGIQIIMPEDVFFKAYSIPSTCTRDDVSPRENRRAINRINALVGAR